MIEQLTEEVVLTRLIRTPDEGGGGEMVFADVAAVFAGVDDRAAQPSRDVDTLLPARRAVLVLRDQPGIDLEMGVRRNGRDHRVTDIRERSPRAGYVTVLIEEVRR